MNSTVYTQVSRLKDTDIFVYRYRRRPLLLVQVIIENTKNKDILFIYTSNHGQ
jgi:hypothetical protein